jgi:CarD family transcriptional regulator
MFEKGEMVYYGTAGVCKVSDICKSPFDKNDDKIYYMLEPNDSMAGTVIYAPAEGGKVTLRAVMTKSEAEELVSSMRDLLPLEITNEKYRREEYRNTLREGTPICLARLIKSVHERKKNALKAKKRLYDTDSEFDKIARRALFGELACVFGISEAEAEALIDGAM